MGTMQVVRGIGASISIGGRSFTKTGIAPVVFIPAYKTLSGTVWHYWAVFGRSKIATAGTVSTPEYTAEYNLTVNGRQVYVLTLDNGAFENGTLMISGPGTINTTIQTGAASQWYDLTSVTAENAALQEAELLLRAVEQKQVAPRAPGGSAELGLLVSTASSITAQRDGWYVGVAAGGRTKSDVNPKFTYSSTGSNASVIIDTSTGNSDGGFGYFCVRVYLKKGQSLSLILTNAATYAGYSIIYQGKI